jgi:hypothetical protein
MHGLEPIAGIRQRAARDGRKGISEIALFERIPQHDLVNFGRFRRNQSFSHGDGLSGANVSGKERIRSLI